MISIKDYAKETGVSYEAVRQRIKRYELDLEGHIHRQGRTQFLDDVAVAFLNEHRLQNPVVLYDKGAGEDFRALQADLQEMKELAREYWDQLKSKEKTIGLLVEENRELRLQVSSVAQLEADNKAAKVKAFQAEENAQKARQALELAEQTFEEDLWKKNEQIEAWKKYERDMQKFLAEDAAYQRRLFKRKKDRPVPPVAPSYQEKENEEE